MGGWLGVGGLPDQMGIRLTSASTGVGVEVGAELGNFLKADISCQCKKFSARGFNSLSEEEFYCRKKKNLDRGRNLL